MPGIARKNKHDHERKQRMVQPELNIWYKKEIIPLYWQLIIKPPLVPSLLPHHSKSLMRETLILFVLCLKDDFFGGNVKLHLDINNRLPIVMWQPQQQQDVVLFVHLAQYHEGRFEVRNVIQTN